MKKIFRIRRNSVVGCKRPLEEISIPAKHRLTHISDRAFSGSETIKRLSIPGNIRIIGYSAFDGARALSTVSFAAAGMVIIKDRAFRRCLELKEIENMPIIISYGFEAFKGCESLTECNINPYLVEFGKGCFEECKSITKVTLPILHSCVPERAFCECEGLTSVEFCSALEVIGERAFYGCISLESVDFSDNLKKICASAYEDCYNIKSISFGGSIKRIEKNAFKNCRSLNTVKFSEVDGGKRISIKSGAFNGCIELRTLIIPNGNWSISPRAFKDCKLSEETPLNIYCEDASTAQGIAQKLNSLVKLRLVNIIVSEKEEDLDAPTNDADVEPNETENEIVFEEEPAQTENKAEKENVKDDMIENQSLADIFEEDED